MENKIVLTNLSAARVIASTFGVLAGLGGIWHSIGEVMQGNVAPVTWWRAHLPAYVRRFLAKSWPWVFGICAISGVLLVVGSVILAYFFGVNNADLFLNNLYFTVLSLLFTILTGIAYDIQISGRGVAI